MRRCLKKKLKKKRFCLAPRQAVKMEKIKAAPRPVKKVKRKSAHKWQRRRPHPPSHVTQRFRVCKFLETLIAISHINFCDHKNTIKSVLIWNSTINYFVIICGNVFFFPAPTNIFDFQGLAPHWNWKKEACQKTLFFENVGFLPGGLYIWVFGMAHPRNLHKKGHVNTKLAIKQSKQRDFAKRRAQKAYPAARCAAYMRFRM